MYLTSRFYIALGTVAFVTALGYVWAPLYTLGRVLTAVLSLLVVAEALALWLRKGITAVRTCPERFSNGDDNEVDIHVENLYPFGIKLMVIDEIPFIFQRRDVAFPLRVAPRGGTTLTYKLRPVERGVYSFGVMRIFASTQLGMVQRRYSCGSPIDIKVYPSYRQLRQYELLAVSNRLRDMGVKRIRRAGNNTEFEQIKDYVAGDDMRIVNWKASARRHQLMVNVYQAERSQQIVNLIDKGRIMQREFRGMTLLDYAINASLVLSYVAIHRQDKAGVVSFNEQMDTLVPPSNRPAQMERIMESLYAVTTDFGETDYSALVQGVELRLAKRSLLILYTNFNDVQSLDRQLPYLLQLARRHRLLVVYFENNGLHSLVESKPSDVEDYYVHVVAQQMETEQQLITGKLNRHGILALRTTPDNLSVDVINKYLEIRHNSW